MGYPAGTPALSTTGSGDPDLQGLAAILRLLTSGEDIGALMRRLDTLHVDYTEAARRLHIPEKWLRERIRSLPHRKMGKFVGFTDEDLKAISEMYAVRPGNDTALSAQGHGVKTAELTPSLRSRSRART